MKCTVATCDREALTSRTRGVVFARCRDHTDRLFATAFGARFPEEEPDGVCPPSAPPQVIERLPVTVPRGSGG